MLQCAFMQNSNFQELCQRLGERPKRNCLKKKRAHTSHACIRHEPHFLSPCCRGRSATQGNQRCQRHGWKCRSWENHGAAEQHHRPGASCNVWGSVLRCVQTPLILTADQSNSPLFVLYQKQAQQNHKKMKRQPSQVWKREKLLSSSLILMKTL